jgi:hypothetical protein
MQWTRIPLINATLVISDLSVARRDDGKAADDAAFRPADLVADARTAIVVDDEHQVCAR